MNLHNNIKKCETRILKKTPMKLKISKRYLLANNTRHKVVTQFLAL
jgi:hypothetical protein